MFFAFYISMMLVVYGPAVIGYHLRYHQCWNRVDCVIFFALSDDSDDNTTDPVAALRKVTKERDELKKKLTIFSEYKN